MGGLGRAVGVDAAQQTCMRHILENLTEGPSPPC